MPSKPHRAPSTPSERRATRARLTDVQPVLEAASALLEVRQRATGELRRRLLTAGYPPSLVEEAIGRLTEAGYLDDESFARSWVESRDRWRPRGEAALRRELLAHGLDAARVSAVLESRRAAASSQNGGYAGTAADADAQAARRLLERRSRMLLAERDVQRRRERAYALLARNGFDPETSREAAAQWTAATGPDGSGDRGDG